MLLQHEPMSLHQCGGGGCGFGGAASAPASAMRGGGGRGAGAGAGAAFGGGASSGAFASCFFVGAVWTESPEGSADEQATAVSSPTAIVKYPRVRMTNLLGSFVGRRV